MLWDKENSISGTHNWVDKSLLHDTKDSFIDKGGGGIERQNLVVDKLDGIAISSAELNSLVADGLCVGVETTSSAACRRNLAEEEGESQGQGKEAGAQEERKEGGEEHED